MADLSDMQLKDDEKKSGSGGMNRTTIIVVTAVVIIAAVSIFILTSGNNSSQQTNAQENARASTSQAMQQTTVTGSNSGIVSAGGYIEARQTAAMLPQRNSKVRKVYVTLGQLVQKGEIILEFESSEQKADVALAEAQMKAAQARYELIKIGARKEEIERIKEEVAAAQTEYEDALRQRKQLEKLDKFTTPNEIDSAIAKEKIAWSKLQALRKQEEMIVKGSREQEIAAAKAEVDLAKAALDKAQAILEDTVFLAPFTGRIVRLDVEEGEALSPIVASTLEIADTTELWVRVDVPENKIAGLDIGDRAEIFVEALNNQKFEASVVEIAPLADRTSNTIEVAVVIKNPHSLLRPNMSARVTIFKENGDES